MTSRLMQVLVIAALFHGAAVCNIQAGVPQVEIKPNVLLITVDDMGWDTPGCFGGTVEDITPNIDRLASEGMRFEKAHVTVAVCQPSRQTMMTGRYPHRFGALGFSPISEEITTLQEVLADNGYINGILGKVIHLQPTHKYKWSYIKYRHEMGYGRDPATYYKDCMAFLSMAREQNKPFFLMANSHDPHRPFHGSDDEKAHFGDELPTITPPSRTYSGDEVTVPGFLPEMPAIRTEVAQYFSSAKRADDTVGVVLKALRDSGQEQNTLVMFMSDNGMAFASAKWNTYLQSTRTPWIVRWPGRVKPGTVDSRHFISGIDFMPTILDVLNLPEPEGMDGKTFLPLLFGMKQDGRDRVITCHYQAIHYYGNKEARMDVLNAMTKDGWSFKDEWGCMIKDFPIRCIQDGRYGYMYNEWSDGTNAYFLGSGLTEFALENGAKYDPEVKRYVDKIKYRVPEEFYDFQSNPHALDNQIDDPEHQARIREMRGRLLKWMEASGDPALPAFRKQIGK